MTASHRLRRLEQILTATSAPPSAVPSSEFDNVTRHLESLPLERIRRLRDLLDRGSAEADEVDAVAMRLLLNDYAAAVAHLRAVARDAGARLDSATGPVGEVRRFLWQGEKLRESLRDTDADPSEQADTPTPSAAPDTLPD